MKCSIVTASLALAASSFAAQKPLVASPSNPNIIFIYGDDIGYGDFSCYGGEVDTAAIDTLAEEGVRFTSGYCTAATCTPSRYSLLTGEYAFRNNVARIYDKACGRTPRIFLPNIHFPLLAPTGFFFFASLPPPYCILYTRKDSNPQPPRSKRGALSN